ncbi:MAG: hypothetical protein ACLFMX_04205 [Halobacteriales archaeon]
MDLRCSLLGHDFAPAEVERRRDAHDAEEVVTTREFRTCRRCSARELVSETTHVRARADGGEDADEDDAEVLAGDLGDDEGDDAPAEPDRDDDIIEAPVEEPEPDVPEAVDLSAFEDDQDAIEATEPDDIVEAPTDEEASDPAPAAEPEAVAFVCPSCGLRERPGRTSLRPGDICPRCRDGYIEERPA